ncbi:MAG: ABC transporter substrate-binding protein [Ruminococcus sp.]|nr:ABC transporter substrate-binding protein [Ruminococcus sp.]
MKIKSTIALILSVLLILSLTACAFSAPEGSVYWLNFKPELDETLQTIAARYQEQTGISVRIETPETGAYRSTLRERMASEDPPTLFVINNQDGVNEWHESALDLTDTDIQKELNTSTYNLSDEDGKLVAIPYCLECYGIAVNPSLIEPLGYSVEDITDFDTLKTLAEVIHNNAFWLGYDAFCSPDLDAEASWRITGHLANVEYYYEERDSGTWQESPASLTGNYLPNFKNIYDLCINNAVSAPEELAAGGHHPTEEFTSGKAAFFLTGSWDYATLSAAIPDVTMIPYYCGVKGEEKAGLNSGSENFWAVNVNASEADQRATLAFMKWLVTDEEASNLLVEQLGSLPYKHASKAENGFLSVQAQYVADGRYIMDWATNHQPNEEVYRADLVTALCAYNADQSDENWEQVKLAFVDGWAKQYAAVNNY